MARAESHFRARAWFLGARIDERQLEDRPQVALHPLVLRVGSAGYAIVFRFGAVCLVAVDPETESQFFKSLEPLVQSPFDEPETEECELVVRPGEPERFDAGGSLTLRELSEPRIQVVADVLAKSTVLAHHEERVASVFDRIETLAAELTRGVRPRRSRHLLREIGGVLLIQSQTVGRVEVTEKPEFIWEDAELDRLHERVAAEYELRDRDLALSRKLDLISRSAETYLDLLHNRQTLRVEWYIVILIFVEIILVLYDIFLAY